MKKPQKLPATINIDKLGPITFVSSSRAQRINVSVKAAGGVRVAVPKRASLKDAQRFVLSKQDWIEKQLIRLKKVQDEADKFSEEVKGLDINQAANKIAARLQELAQEHNFSYNRLTIRNQKTRWGSCSAKNNISLNIKLALLPDELRDLVLVHELIHTKIKNHGPNFWQKLEEIYPQARELDQQVNNHSGLLRLPLQ
ncbi:MAG: SprT family zinc-dependent metalloprotease [Pseudomonadota bacterium]|nr:SprT family zinc-dependent metalloprotease [Pseudomonadota bacterium]